VSGTAPPLKPERDWLIRKLESIGDVSDAEKNAIHELPMKVKNLADGKDIVTEGESYVQKLVTA
jgi:hypothetical protein